MQGVGRVGRARGVERGEEGGRERGAAAVVFQQDQPRAPVAATVAHDGRNLWHVERVPAQGFEEDVS